MKLRAVCLVLALGVLSLGRDARADDTGTVLLVLGGGQVALNALSTLTFAAVDITYAARGRTLHKGWAIPQVVYGALSVIAGGINLGVGVALRPSYSGGDDSGSNLFLAIGGTVMASGIWYIAHGAYALTRDRAPPDPAAPVAPFFACSRNGALAGVALRF